MVKTKKTMEQVANEQKAQQMNSDPEEVKKQEALKKAEKKKNLKANRLETKRLLELQIDSHEAELKFRRDQVTSGEILEVSEKYVSGVIPVWLMEITIKNQERELNKSKRLLEEITKAIEDD